MTAAYQLSVQSDQLIHSLLKGGPFENDVDHKLCEMTLLKRPVSCLTLTVDSLGRAKEILTENLMSNPYLKGTVRHELITLLQNNPEDAQILQKVQKNLETARCDRDTVDRLLGALNSCPPIPSWLEVSGDRWPSLYQTKMLLQHLLHVCRYEEKEERLENYLVVLLDQVSENRGWDVATSLICLLCEEEDSNPECCSTVLKCTLGWLSRDLSDIDCERMLSSMSPAQAARAAASCEPFLQLYLRALSLWADRFLPFVDHLGRVTWRSPTSSSTSSDFTQHLEKLLQLSDVSPRARTDTLGLITGRVRDLEYSVWSHVCHTLLQTLKKG
ncbi:uncharacterized protein LOC101857400 isoform X2 [Aplysia californica]|uniref:Uncharacterized protein LOC101857400 isoform X2 n=1 Tax=Aplysia californica TaxID=6500 RepID=A0ABM1VRK9_APLCA|nr:uncharacterized protein LOC101857400 isoform X2 [Aplysia californica]